MSAPKWDGLILARNGALVYLPNQSKAKTNVCKYSHSTLLQAEEKRARNSVPKCPFKQPQPTSGRSAG